MGEYNYKQKDAQEWVQPLRRNPEREKNLANSAILRRMGASEPKPLSASMRERFESGFAADFSNIRVSRGYVPPELGGKAVMRGTDILLSEDAGEDVLGHELAHVVQQALGRVPRGGFPVVREAGLEQEADAEGAKVAAGGVSSMTGGFSTIVPLSPACAPSSFPVMCKDKPNKELRAQARARQAQDVTEDKADSAQVIAQMQGKVSKEQYDAYMTDSLNHRREDLMGNLDSIRNDENMAKRFGGLLPMLEFMEANPDINLKTDGAAHGVVENDGSANVYLNGVGTGKAVGGLQRAQMLHEMTHVRNTVTGFNRLNTPPGAQPFTFSEGSKMLAGHTPVNTMGTGTKEGNAMGKAVNEPRGTLGVTSQTVQDAATGGSNEVFAATLNEYMHAGKSKDTKERSAAVRGELERLVGPGGITKVQDDKGNMAEPTAYANQMMYLIFENRDLFDEGFYDSDVFKGIQSMVSQMNDESNYTAAGDGESAHIDLALKPYKRKP